MSAMLAVEHVTKRYRRGPVANDDICLEIAAGEVFGLLGPNGAGKTTLVRQVIGRLEPTTGAIRVDGVDVVAHPEAARELCSYQPQTHVPLTGLTPLQAMELVGRLRGHGKADVRRRAHELVQTLQMEEWATVRGERLSGGAVRLVAYCMAAVAPGKLVIFDEPTNDIDPLRRRLLWEEIRRVRDAGSAVLLVTHNVLEAERAVDRLAIIDRGRIVAQGTPGSMKSALAGRLRIEMTLEPDRALVDAPWAGGELYQTGRRRIAEIPAHAVSEAVTWAQRLKEQRVVEEYAIGPATLEDVYVRVVTDESNGKGDVELRAEHTA